MSDNIKPTGTDPDDASVRVRHTALSLAVQLCGKSGDYQEVIRCARDILTFLKEG